MSALMTQDIHGNMKHKVIPTVIKIDSGKNIRQVPRPTDAELQNEYNYILAENLTKKLLEKGLISVEEFNKIMEKNRRTFSPLFSRI